MLRAAMICPNRELAAQLQEALDAIGGVFVLRSLGQYPTAVELARFVRGHAPQLLFVSFENLARAKDMIPIIQDCAPGVQVIAIHHVYEPALLIELMHLGIREVLADPFDRNLVYGCVQRSKEQLERRPALFNATDLVYSFLPSKAGAGTSTLVANTARILAASAKAKVLLGDYDLNSGMMRFMLKLDNAYCVVDAAERALDLDENFWPQLVTSIGDLDVLHAGNLRPNFRMEGAQVRGIMDFARRNYRVICNDLSGNLEKYSIELMHESKQVFLVCTPEIASLHLAKEKFEYLQTLDLAGKISVIVNRYHRKNAFELSEIEKIIGLPVYLAFPNDYQGVNRALVEARPVSIGTEFGRQCATLAQAMFEHSPAASQEKKRFIEYFSLAPTRGLAEARKTAS